MIEELELDTEDRLKVFTHPYRMKLIHVLREMNRPATATEVARVLGDGPGKVHYHMRLLEQTGIVTLVRTETVNGIIARFYEPGARHYRVKGASLGSEGDASLRDEVARLITLRFKDGLRAFLERTTSTTRRPAANEEAGSFLYDLTLHCSDDDWLHLRTVLDEFAARYREAATGTLARHIFVAGATDYRPDELAQAEAQHSNQAALTLVDGIADARWTFGVSLIDTPARFRPSLPPL